MDDQKNNKHRNTVCLNCGSDLGIKQRFCANCGQENNDFKLSVKELFFEFFRSIFNLDSRLGHSMVPFLIRPGFLPKAFMEGKRKRYVHPVRFYLLSSVFFFFLFAKGSPFSYLH